MIVSVLKGGLGNMMFQIAAGISLANDIKSDFAYTLDGWNSVTKYKIDHLPHTIFKNIKCISKEEITSKFSLYRESQFNYIPLPLKDNLLLDGYFQSEKYFAHNKEKIKLTFNIEHNEQYKDYTFLHVRRKDYLLHSQIHSICSNTYYQKALDLIKPNKCIVLSDDIEWCQKNMNFSNLEFSTSKTEIQDLSIMISSKNSIIANSTFSWWGAWLSNSNNVVAPKNWFGPQGPKNWDDIYANNWIVL